MGRRRVALGDRSANARTDPNPPETRRARDGRGRELLLLSPKKGEGMRIVGDSEGAECRDIERVADVRESVQAVQPPDGAGGTVGVGLPAA
jgi:hypothetical protein